MKVKASNFLRIVSMLCVLVLLMSMSGCGAGEGSMLSLRETGLDGIDAKQLRGITELDLRDGGVDDISMLLECDSLVRLDLRGNDISVEQYEQLQEALPECKIIWDVPIIGKTYDSTTLKLVLEGEDDGTAGNIRYLTDLRFCDMFMLSGLDNDEMAAIRESKPEAEILWRIRIGNYYVRSDETEFRYTASYGDDLSDLRYCSQLESAMFNNAGASVDYSTLAQIPTLRSLTLSFSDITDFSALPEFTGLTELNLYYTAFDDLSLLSGLTGLEILSCGNDLKSIGEFGSLDAISGLTSLKRLSMTSAGISDISALEGMTELEYLSIENNPIEDFSPLAGLTQLETLVITNTFVSDLSFLENLTALKKLYIGDVEPELAADGYAHPSLGPCRVEDFSPVGKLVNLDTLVICHTGLEDVSFAASLKEASYIALYDNNISDFSPLKALRRLETLVIYDNPIDMAQKAELFLAMPNTVLSTINPLA